MKDIEKPVILQQKIDYLKQKMVQVLHQTWQSDNMRFKLAFTQFVDLSIDSLYTISSQEQQRIQRQKRNAQIQKNKAQSKNSNEKQQTSKDKYNQQEQQQQVAKAKFYSSEKQKLQIQRLIYQSKLHALSVQQQKLQNQKLKIKNQTQQLKNKSLLDDYQKKIYDLKDEINYLKQKSKNQDKQLQRLGKINIHQTDQIETLKQQRNRAQINQIKVKEQLEKLMKDTQQFSNKGNINKIKNSEGLKIRKIYTNLSEQKQSQRLIMLDLPVVIEANKIIYGISIGLQLSSRQIVYCDDIRIFEKQMVKISAQNNHVKAQFIKRKESTLSAKFKIHRPQIVVMLFGKGDSITVHQ